MRVEKPNGADTSATPATALLPQREGDSAKTKVRRTRGAAPNPRSHAAKKANGHANGSANHAAAADGPTSVSSGLASTNPETRPGSRVNGHDQASWSVPAAADSPLSPSAGSDDARGASVAIAAGCAAAGADRDACAALAEGTNGTGRRISKDQVSGFVLTNPEPNEDEPRVPSEKLSETKSEAGTYPPGEEPLPADPADFVEEIHQRVDLFEVWVGLLNSLDDKIKQRAVEKLTEMRYKGAQSFADEPQQIVIDIDSAVARRAAQGAQK